MTSKATKKPITIRFPKNTGPDVLLKNFLEGYDYCSWANRAALLDLVVSQPEFCNKIEDAVKLLLEGGPSLSNEQIVKTAKLEMHFTAYHSTESLLGLLFAFMIDPSAPWVWLTYYRSKEFNALVSKLAKDGLSMFAKDQETIVKTLFFVGNHVKEQEINNSSKFGVAYLKDLAKEFQDRASYNSYKHGLRTLAPHDFKASFGPLQWQELTTTYLVITSPVKWNNSLVSDLQVVYRAIDYDRSKRIIKTNTQLMHNLFEIKKAILRGETQIKLFTFEHEKAFDILGPSKNGNTMNTMTISPAPLDQKP